MRNIWAFLLKEMQLYFQSATAYVVATAFLVLSGFFFYTQLTDFAQMLSYYQYYQQNPMVLQQLNVNDFVVGPLFNNINVILLLVIPLITMRSFAEEKKLGTEELILTSPVSVNQVVIGKFLAAMAFYICLLALTSHFPLILYKMSTPDTGKVLSGYLGLLLIGGTFISFGLFTSSLTSNQVVAAIFSFAVLLLFWIVGWLAESVQAPFGDILAYVSVTEHFNSFLEGVIRLEDVVFYLTFIFFSLFLTARAVESTRWR